MQLTVRRSGFDHPQWDLQSLPIGLAHGHRQAWLTQPGDDLETAAMERMEWIVDRHRGRHGIQRGCRSTPTCTCLALPGFGGHLIRGDDGLGGDDHDSEETEVFDGVLGSRVREDRERTMEARRSRNPRPDRATPILDNSATGVGTIAQGP